MTQITDQVMASTKTATADFKRMAEISLSGYQKMVELNMAAARSALEDAAEQAQTVFAAKEPQDMGATAESAVAYGRALAAIVTDTNTALSKVAESRFADVQAQAIASIEAALKQAPAGSEAAVAAFQSALSTGQKALESAKAQAKQASEAVEKNFAAATDMAVKTTKSARKAK